MRFDLRLHGRTESGRECVMELTVHAQSQSELVENAKKQSAAGPWYYCGTSEPVPTTEKITVEHVEQVEGKAPPSVNGHR
jgi:hypothetical protein